MDQPPEGDARVVLVTAPGADVGRRIARDLVGARLAACVNLVPGVTSIYRWEGTVQEDGEVLLVIKTRAHLLERLERELVAAHPYEVPECIALEASRVEARYLAWLVDATSGDGGR